MLTTLVFTIVVFIEILWYLIFFDVILSWLLILGVNFRPKWLRDIIDPMYIFVRKYVPTRIGMFDFTPIVIIFILMFVRGLVLIMFPEVASQITTLMR